MLRLQGGVSQGKKGMRASIRTGVRNQKTYAFEGHVEPPSESRRHIRTMRERERESPTTKGWNIKET